MPKINDVSTIEVVGGNVLVEVIEEKKETDAGVFLPDSASEKETVVHGMVVAIPKYVSNLMDGNGDFSIKLPEEMIRTYTMFLKVGDIVLCKKFDYSLVKVGDESKEYRIYNASSIISVIRQTNES